MLLLHYVFSRKATSKSAQVIKSIGAGFAFYFFPTLVDAGTSTGSENFAEHNQLVRRNVYCGTIILCFTPRCPEGRGLRGPFFIGLSVGVSICQSVPFSHLMKCYQDMSPPLSSMVPKTACAVYCHCFCRSYCN
jgi:hypothetical protein